MTRRYDCLNLTLLIAALTVGISPTSASAQGACCYNTFPVGNASKTVSLQYACQLISQSECLALSEGEFQGEGTLCGVQGSWNTMEECRGATLPVELTSFDVFVDGGDAVLTWSTASETNNAGFAVETEFGTDVFAEIGFVEGHGTTVEPREYSFAVRDLDPGVHRFRLKRRNQQ